MSFYHAKTTRMSLLVTTFAQLWLPLLEALEVFSEKIKTYSGFGQWYLNHVQVLGGFQYQ